MSYFGGGGGGSGNVDGTFVATRVPFASGASTLTDDADMTFSTDTLTVTKVSTPTIEMGSGATDTTVTRGAAGQIAVEGSLVPTMVSTNTWASAGGNIWATNQTVNSDQTINFGSSGNSRIQYNTTQTPDTMMLRLGALSNSLHICADADGNTDANNGPSGTAAAAHPMVLINNTGGSTTQYLGASYFGFAGRAIKSLTAGAATAVVRIPVASGAGTGGELRYTVFASDGTDHQARSGTVHFMGVNKAGTETAAVYGIDSVLGVVGTANPNETQDGSGVGAISSGTLTYTWGVSTAAANAFDLTLNAASSLTETTLDIYYRVDLNGPGQPVPQ